MEPNLRRYEFDAIVTRFDFPECPQVEEEQPEDVEPCLDVELIIKNEIMVLEPSRVQVVDFPKTPLFEFNTQPYDLCDALRNDFVVNVYKKGKRKGTGNISLPNFLIRQLFDDPCLLTHLVECEIIARKKTIGVVELNIRIKSGDMPEKHTCNIFDTGAYDICQPVDKSLGPLDLLCVMGRSAKTPKLHCISQKRLMSGEAPAPFICPQEWKPKEQPPPQESCNFNQMISGGMNEDELAEVMRTSKFNEAPQREQPSYTPITELKDVCRCYEINSYSSSSQLSMSKAKKMNWSSAIDEPKRDEDEFWKTPCPPIPAPELVEYDFEVIRSCMVCGEDISWIPKISGCPYCGYKSIPVCLEKPYDENQKAADILTEYVQKDKEEKISKPALPCGEEGKDEEPRCTCLKNQTCARCRIRKLCEDMLKKDKVIKRKSEPGTVVKKKKKEPLPTLVKVFEDMKAVFEKKAKEACPPVDDKMKECEEICENQVKKHPKKSRKNANKRQRFMRKNLKVPFPKYKKPKPQRKIKSRVYTNLPRRLTDNLHFGHKSCLNDGGMEAYQKVPCHMGWLWSLDPQAKKNKNWKPGAIARPIRQIMSYFLINYPVDSIPTSRYACHDARKRREQQLIEAAAKEAEPPLIQQPTLHVCKKKGEYFITLRPLKDSESLSKCPDPYLEMKPVRFRIAKNAKMLERHKLKEALFGLGFESCICEKPVVECFCRGFCEKRRLMEEVENQCIQNKIESIDSSFVLSDLSESEEEYDFGVTPPAGLVKPNLTKKPDMVNSETQYDEKDWHLPYKFSEIPFNPFYWYTICSGGEKPKQKEKVKKSKKDKDKGKGKGKPVAKKK